MITVELNHANFEYDIHSLVKAFYPEHDVLVKAPEPGEAFPDSVFHLKIRYAGGEPDRILFSFHRGREWDASVCASVLSVADSPLSEARPIETEPDLLTGEVETDFADRKTTKNRLKQRLYELLSDFSGKSLPWGTLTGIRPTRIPLGMLERGESEEAIRAYMREMYFTSDEKIDLSIEVAKRERELLSRIDYEDGYSLYIGIPFCPSTCLYCSFTSYPISTWKKRVDDYLDALEQEIRFVAEACRDKYLNSVYIGGGTPTSLSPEHLERLITMVGTYFRLFDEDGRIVYGGLDRAEHGVGSPDAADRTEHAASGPGTGDCTAHHRNHLLVFTVEAGRPDSITREKLQVLRAHNISRISINPQTMKPGTLRLIGRNHTVGQTKESFALAREMGFDNINMDLIVGLPEESIDDVRHTMDELDKLRPDNITVHSLAIKRAARLRMQQEDYAHLHIENTWETIRLTADCCRQMGLSPYYLYRQKNMAGNFENVGYAAPDKAGVYNILIMEEKQTIMALGAGATSKVVFGGGERIERAGNVKEVSQYIDRIDEMIGRKRKLLELAQADT